MNKNERSVFTCVHSTLSRQVKGPDVSLDPVRDLDGVVAFLLVGRIADLHPGHLRCATDPHLLRGGDLTLPAGLCGV